MEILKMLWETLKLFYVILEGTWMFWIWIVPLLALDLIVGIIKKRRRNRIAIKQLQNHYRVYKDDNGDEVITFSSGEKSASSKGRLGELSVSRILSSLPNDKYHLLNDVMLPSNDSTTQIDHILISVYGIFVIETKNYSGDIYGSEWSNNWSQNIYGNKESFKNPIHQNYGHIKTIEGCLSNHSSLPFTSIIVFSDKAKLHIDAKETPVINEHELINCINTISTVEIITDELVDEIVETIKAKNITDSDLRSKHNNEAKYRKFAKNENHGTCPMCDGNLVVRHGKYGTFLGCSNYPKCKFTEE